MKQVDEHVFVAGQIRPEDLPGIKAAGVTAIVNNRPDDEEPDQPSTAEMAVAAQAAGLSYQHIPMAGGLSPALVEEMANALAEAEGPLLAFCRSGTRSTYLWALAEARRGADGEELMRKAAAAGYDLTPIARFL
ncbi:MAG TPA: TIGR01244 family sulfur transferase [Allosphingosinicella sp.]